jgi:MIP family channel proteins
MNNINIKKLVAEAIGTFALVFVGVLAIRNQPIGGDLLMVALAHGLTIGVMASATCAISGGHLNPAVTMGVWAGGKMHWKMALQYVGAQLLGATLAGLFIALVLKGSVVSRGTPTLNYEVTWFTAVLLEAVASFFLVFVVFGTATDTRGPKIGGMAIGLTVAIGIMAIGPFTGGVMNPARAFGPALASGDLFRHFGEQLAFWVGPLLGGAGAGYLYGRFFMKDECCGGTVKCAPRQEMEMTHNH